MLKLFFNIKLKNHEESFFIVFLYPFVDRSKRTGYRRHITYDVRQESPLVYKKLLRIRGMKELTLICLLQIISILVECM